MNVEIVNSATDAQQTVPSLEEILATIKFVLNDIKKLLEKFRNELHNYYWEQAARPYEFRANNQRLAILNELAGNPLLEIGKHEQAIAVKQSAQGKIAEKIAELDECLKFFDALDNQKDVFDDNNFYSPLLNLLENYQHLIEQLNTYLQTFPQQGMWPILSAKSVLWKLLFDNKNALVNFKKENFGAIKQYQQSLISSYNNPKDQAILLLKKEILQQETSLATLKTNVQNLQEQLSAAQGKMRSDLEEQMKKDYGQEIEALKEKVKSLTQMLTEMTEAKQQLETTLTATKKSSIESAGKLMVTIEKLVTICRAQQTELKENVLNLQNDFHRNSIILKYSDQVLLNNIAEYKQKVIELERTSEKLSHTHEKALADTREIGIRHGEALKQLNTELKSIAQEKNVVNAQMKFLKEAFAWLKDKFSLIFTSFKSDVFSTLLTIKLSIKNSMVTPTKIKDAKTSQKNSLVQFIETLTGRALTTVELDKLVTAFEDTVERPLLQKLEQSEKTQSKIHLDELKQKSNELKTTSENFTSLVWLLENFEISSPSSSQVKQPPAESKISTSEKLTPPPSPNPYVFYSAKSDKQNGTPTTPLTNSTASSLLSSVPGLYSVYKQT